MSTQEMVDLLFLSGTILNISSNTNIHYILI